MYITADSFNKDHIYNLLCGQVTFKAPVINLMIAVSAEPCTNVKAGTTNRYLSINLSICPSVRLSIHLSIYLASYVSIDLFSRPSVSMTKGQL